MTKIKLTAAILAGGMAASAPAQAADARDLVMAASRPPTASFQGRRMVVNWYGQESQAQEFLVYYRAPGLWRQEILSPTGGVERIVLQRDGWEWIYDPNEKTLVRRSPATLKAGNVDSEGLLGLLLGNYALKSRGRKELLNGHAAQRVELIPRHAGGPRRILWVDPERGIVLKTKQLTANGSLVSETHFMELDVDVVPDQDLFVPPEASPGNVVDEAPRESVPGPAAVEVEGFHDLPWIKKLPQGFVMDHVTLIPLGKDNALHFRYVDGLSVLSFFISPRPIEEDAGSVPLLSVGHDDPTFSFSSPIGNILRWEQSGLYCLLVGDLEPDHLRTVRKTLFGEKR